MIDDRKKIWNDFKKLPFIKGKKTDLLDPFHEALARIRWNGNKWVSLNRITPFSEKLSKEIEIKLDKLVEIKVLLNTIEKGEKFYTWNPIL